MDVDDEEMEDVDVVDVEVVPVVPSHPASLAIIHQKALPFNTQLNPCEWAQLGRF